MNTRTKTNLDGVFVVEVDIVLDVPVTFVFTRENGPLVYDRCTVAVVISTGQTIRAMYAGNVPDVGQSGSTAYARAFDQMAHNIDALLQRQYIGHG